MSMVNKLAAQNDVFCRMWYDLLEALSGSWFTVLAYICTLHGVFCYTYMHMLQDIAVSYNASKSEMALGLVRRDLQVPLGRES